jgi:hypothetical protein
MNINEILATVSQKARTQGLLNVLDESSPIIQGFGNLGQEEVAGILATFIPGIEPMKKLQAAAAATTNISGNSWDYFKKALDYSNQLLANQGDDIVAVLEFLNATIGMVIVGGQDKSIAEWIRENGGKDDHLDGLEDMLMMVHPAFHNDVRQAHAWHHELNNTK